MGKYKVFSHTLMPVVMHDCLHMLSGKIEFWRDLGRKYMVISHLTKNGHRKLKPIYGSYIHE